MKNCEYVYVVSLHLEPRLTNKLLRPVDDRFTFKHESDARDFMKRKIAEYMTWGDKREIKREESVHDQGHLWYEFTDIYAENAGLYSFVDIRVELTNEWVHEGKFPF